MAAGSNLLILGENLSLKAGRISSQQPCEEALILAQSMLQDVTLSMSSPLSSSELPSLLEGPFSNPIKSWRSPNESVTARAFPIPQFCKPNLQPVRSSHPRDQRPEVLIVDGQPDSLNLLMRVFAEQQFAIRIAPNGALALQSILVQPPDLVLLDLSLPDQSGFELCRQLQADPETRHIPIIFISAQTESEAKAKAFRLGGVDFISKPFEAVELLARVHNQLRIRAQWHHSQQRNEHQQQLLQEHRALKQLLYHEKELAEVTLQSIGDAVVTVEAKGQITSLNPLAEQLLQLTRQQAKNRPVELAFRILNERTGCIIKNPVTLVLRDGKIVALEDHHVMITATGQEFPVSQSVAPIRDRFGAIVGAVMVFRDVTESREMARRLSWQATHDPLTQLINRSELERQLAAAVLEQNGQQTTTLCFMDLERFKIVNDTCGHKAGDELLRQVTLTMQQQLSSQDILARVGGDEFALILLDRPPEQAEQVAEEICRAVQQFCFAWDNKNFRIGVSIGLVHLNEKHCDMASALNCADAACYYSKNKGGSQVQIYSKSNRELNQRRDDTQWINRVNLALQEARFCLYGQPIMAIAPEAETSDETDDKVKLVASHQEILIRMIGEDGHSVPPMSFIPIAERYDLMPEIDLWVVENFLRYYSQTAQQQGSNRYTINLSGASISSPKFVDDLEKMLHRTSVPMEAICFEITETAAILSLHAAAKSMRQLKKLGCSFALDDFGSGMSSLTYLKHLPVDYLKIDGSFVRNIHRSPIDRAMVEGFIGIAKVMNLKTIAEYAESDAVLQELRAIGADYAQGDAVAQPHLLFIDEVR